MGPTKCTNGPHLDGALVSPISKFFASSSESQDEMEHGSTADFVLGRSLVIVHLEDNLSMNISSDVFFVTLCVTWPFQIDANSAKIGHLWLWIVTMHKRQSERLTCLPEKISLCCGGGIPSFSSTRSLIRSTLQIRTRSVTNERA